jgi:hypothetical protein
MTFEKRMKKWHDKSNVYKINHIRQKELTKQEQKLCIDACKSTWLVVMAHEKIYRTLIAQWIRLGIPMRTSNPTFSGYISTRCLKRTHFKMFSMSHSFLGKNIFLWKTNSDAPTGLFTGFFFLHMPHKMFLFQRTYMQTYRMSRCACKKQNFKHLKIMVMHFLIISSYAPMS